MREFFMQLIDYHECVNNEILDRIKSSSRELSNKGLSLLSHSIIAHQIWNARILDKTPMGLANRLSLKECDDLLNSCNLDTRKIIDGYSLDDIIEYSNSKGDKYSNSIRDIIFHITNHYSHNRGHILAEMRSSGIQPSIADYIHYKRK